MEIWNYYWIEKWNASEEVDLRKRLKYLRFLFPPEKIIKN